MGPNELDGYRKKLGENYPTLRDQYAMAAIGSIIERYPEGELLFNHAAQMAYEIADAMMTARMRKKPTA